MRSHQFENIYVHCTKSQIMNVYEYECFEHVVMCVKVRIYTKYFIHSFIIEYVALINVDQISSYRTY